MNPSSYTLTFALGFSVLAVGGVHTPVLLACAGVLGLGAVVQLGRPSPPSATRWAGWVWTALVAYCLLQLCPLPHTWLAAVAPRNADVWMRSVRPWGEAEPAWASLSLAPGRTWVEALKVAAVGLSFYLGRCWGGERGSTGPRRVVFGCALALAVVSLGHQALAADTLYGLYHLRDAADVAPLPNGNSRAGYLLLGLFCGLPDALGRARHVPGAAAGLALIGLALLLCESRSGTACLAAGLASAAVWLPLSQRTVGSAGPPRDRGRLRRRLWGLGFGMGLLAIVYQTVSPQEGLRGLLSDSSSKLELLSGAAQMASSFWLFGVGRGAFGSVFPSFQTDSHARSYEHAENFVLQWASEWGLGVTALVVGGLSLSFVGALRQVGIRDRASDSLRPRQAQARRCCLLGLGWLAIQNGVDLGFELPAVAMSAAALLGAVSSRPEPVVAAPPEQRERRGCQGRAQWGALVASAGLSALGAALGACPALPRVRQELHEAAAATPQLKPQELPALRQAVRWFPSEPYFPLLGSGLAQRTGFDPLPWAALALERAPRSVDAHRAVAEALATRGARRQALDTLRLAAKLPPPPGEALAASIWRVAPAVELALRAVPEGPGGAVLLAALGRISEAPPAARREFLKAALARDPKLRKVRLSLARDWFDEARSRQPAAASQGPEARTHEAVDPTPALLQSLELVRGQHGIDRDTRVLEARVLTALGRHADAEALLHQVCGTPLSGPCPRAWLELDLGRKRDGKASASAWLAAACSGAAACSRAHREIGRLHTEHGLLGPALRHYRRATLEAPSRASFLDLARAAERAGQRALAQRAAERARTLGAATRR